LVKEEMVAQEQQGHHLLTAVAVAVAPAAAMVQVEALARAALWVVYTVEVVEEAMIHHLRQHLRVMVHQA
jgi:hypothetical protein